MSKYFSFRVLSVRYVVLPATFAVKTESLQPAQFLLIRQRDLLALTLPEALELHMRVT